MPRRAAAVGTRGAPRRPGSVTSRRSARRVPNRTPEQGRDARSLEPRQADDLAAGGPRSSTSCSSSPTVRPRTVRLGRPRSARTRRRRRGGYSSRCAGARPSPRRPRRMVTSARGHGSRLRAVAHHGDAVGDREDLLEPMGHVEHRDARRGQLAQDREQALRLALVEGRVGLVEDEQAGTLEEHAAELDELSLAEAELAHERVRVGAQPDAAEDRAPRAARIAARVDETEARRLGVGEQVGQDRALREEAQLLVDDADARAPGVLRGSAKRTGSPSTRDLAGVRAAPPRRGSSSAWTCRRRSRRRPRGRCRLDVEVHVRRGPGCRHRTCDRPGHRDRRRGGRRSRAARTACRWPVDACRRPRLHRGYLDSFSMGSRLSAQFAMMPSTSGW